MIALAAWFAAGVVFAFGTGCASRIRDERNDR